MSIQTALRHASCNGGKSEPRAEKNANVQQINRQPETIVYNERFLMYTSVVNMYLDVWCAEQEKQLPLILLQWFALKLLCKLITRRKKMTSQDNFSNFLGLAINMFHYIIN